MFIINLVDLGLKRELCGKDKENVCIEGRKITLRYTLQLFTASQKLRNRDLLRTVHIFQRTYYSKRFIVEFMQNSPRRWQFKISNLFTCLQLLNGSVKDSGNGFPSRISFIKAKPRCKSDHGHLKRNRRFSTKLFPLYKSKRNRERRIVGPRFGIICMNIERFGKYLIVNRAVFHWRVKYIRLQNSHE